MGTKLNPGKFDCYENAEPDEPMFILLARDPLAPILVEQWAALREHLAGNPSKVAEARECAQSMRSWRVVETGGELMSDIANAQGRAEKWLAWLDGVEFLEAHSGGREPGTEFATSDLIDLLTALTRDLEQARQTNREWLTANAPGGWIDDLRVRLSALTQAIRDLEQRYRDEVAGRPYAAMLSVAADDLRQLREPSEKL